MKKKGIGLITALCMGLQTAAVLPPLQTSAALLLSAEFETTDDSFQARGAATVGWQSDEKYQENCSLFVHDREATWAGALRSADSFMSAGQTYALSAAVMQNSGEAVEMKFSLQYTDAEGTTNYSAVALETIESGTWAVLSNSAYTVPEGAKNIAIYMETTESLTDFYLDSVQVTGKPSMIKAGDANGDLKVNLSDIIYLQKYLLAQQKTIDEGADFDGNGVIDGMDLQQLKNSLLYPKTTSIAGDWDNYQESASASTLQIWKDGVARVGNTSRIREKIAKAQSGEAVTVGYLGGSITGGGSSSSPSLSFASLSFDYFNETFSAGKNAKYVNAGVAGTSSVVGNMRVQNDIFAKNCDIIFIEFAVNDQDGDRFQKSYESLVKTCLMQENAPAVVLITLCTKSGGSCQNWMEKIAQNYDLPLISGKNAVMNGISNGTLDWDRDYGSNDTIHPGNGGHKIISELIAYYYRQALRSENNSDEYVMPNTEVFGADYVNAKLTDISSLSGFSAGSWNKESNNGRFEGGYTYTYSKNGNTPLTFKTEGKGILLLFQSNSSNMGSVNVTVNGVTKKVSSQLQWTWGGPDGDMAYFQNTSGTLDVSISSADGGTFVLYGVAVVK